MSVSYKLSLIPFFFSLYNLSLRLYLLAQLLLLFRRLQHLSFRFTAILEAEFRKAFDNQTACTIKIFMNDFCPLGNTLYCLDGLLKTLSFAFTCNKLTSTCNQSGRNKADQTMASKQALFYFIMNWTSPFSSTIKNQHSFQDNQISAWRHISFLISVCLLS